MKLTTRQMKNLVRQVNLDFLLWEELEDPESEVSEFINAFTLNFMVRHIKPENHAELVSLLEEIEKVDSEENHQALWQFVDQNIADFENRFSKELAEKLIEIKQKT